MNLRDCWDSTPLYYACLCGHIELVEYLLENGARCEANSFDGERCLYGALTDQIRSLLRNLKVRVTKLDQYELFLERLYELTPYSDVTFEIKNSLFRAHKCILAARSEYFRLKFENKWKNRTWINGSHELLVPEAFESILKYIYTDRFSTLKIHFSSCLRLARLFKLNDLLQEFSRKLYTIDLREAENDTNTLSLDNDGNIKLKSYDVSSPQNEEMPIDEADIFLIGKFGANTKLNHTITIEPKDLPISSSSSSESSVSTTSRISADFKKLAYFSLPEDIRKKFFVDDLVNCKELEKVMEFTHDLRFHLCEEAENQEVTFNVHKAFIAERCDYFKAFLHDPFHEIQVESTTADQDNATAKRSSSSKKNISQLKLKEVTREVLVEIIFFIYTDNFSRDKLDESILYDVLIVADLYLLPSLKRKCAHELSTHYLNKENIFDLLKISRVYELKKLEFSCIYFLAANIFELEKSEQLREMILEDASKLKMRQETDTIDLVDDLRYAINELAMTNSLSILINGEPQNVPTTKQSNKSNYKSSYERVIDREIRLDLIDKILRELNLEC